MTKAKVLQTTHLRMLGEIFMHSIFVISCYSKFAGQANPRITLIAKALTPLRM